MDKELLTKWTEALRSGKYEQGRGRLRYVDKFCCLGVLCDIVDPTKWVLCKPETLYVYLNDKHECNSSTLPSDLAFRENIFYPIQDHLIDLNDNKGKSFVEIADWIEKNL